MASAPIRKAELDAYFADEVAVKIWIEEVLGIELPNDYFTALQNGAILCQLMLELKERSIPSINQATDGEELPFFKVKNNILFFLAACEEEFNMPK
jgi:hypothetical protein